MKRRLILAGDAGGTKTNLAVYACKGTSRQKVREQRFKSSDYPGLAELLQDFLKPTQERISAAAIAIAGAIVDGHVQTPNLPWEVEQQRLQRAVGLTNLQLINDLEATAYGIPWQPEDQFAILNIGKQRAGNAVLLAAGTGLGQSLLFFKDGELYPSPSEGGHSDFGPTSEIQLDLWRFLQNEFGHVSYERLLSGPGLYNIYRYLKTSQDFSEPSWFTERLAKEDPAALIAQTALENKLPICVEALDLFVSIYGAEAGNLALKGLAIGGVFIGGGIAPKILPKLQEGGFMRSFTAKGRYRDLLAAMPVKVILNPKTALDGAARYGLMHSDS